MDFEIKNNFIPPKAQEMMMAKFGRELGRDGNLLGTDGNILGTETVVEDGSLQPVENLITSTPPIIDEPIPVPGEKINQLI
tara:strand:- start:285 stop:527 length:243 start_codon:yes stop_codon:yes gene_type:complete